MASWLKSSVGAGAIWAGAPADVAGQTVIVVDDGIATGATTRAALRMRKPKNLVLAVPVAPTESLAAMRQECDEVVCLEDHEIFGAIGLFYSDFGQVSDEEVIATVKRFSARKFAERAIPHRLRDRRRYRACWRRVAELIWINRYGYRGGGYGHLPGTRIGMDIMAIAMPDTGIGTDRPPVLPILRLSVVGYGGAGIGLGTADTMVTLDITGYGYGGSHLQWCLDRYRSYDPSIDTFRGYDGYRASLHGSLLIVV